MNALGRVFDILVFCAMGFLLPIIVSVCLQEQVAIINADVIVQSFAENASTKGYVNWQMYENFVRQLDATGMLFSSDMVVEHEVLAPEYVLRSIEDTEGYLNGLWSGTNVLNQPLISPMFPDVIDPGTPPAGVITNTESIPITTNGPSAAHVHTAACFLGHNHAALGCTMHTHTDVCRCPGEFRAKLDDVHCCGLMQIMEYKPGTNYARGQCTHCGYTVWKYVGDGSWYHWTYPVYQCHACGYTNNHNTEYVNRGDRCLNMATCGKTGQWNCGYTSEDTTTECGFIITSMVPISAKQALSAGQSPDVRAKVTFADGHSAIVNCSISGFSVGSYNTVQDVMLSYGTYSGSLSNVRPSTCTIQLTVQCPSRICTKGHFYYLVNGNATPCPYCAMYAERIMVLGADHIPFHIQRGESLQDNGIQLHVEYMDGQAETISTGWVDNLDIEYVGLQTVTIGYAGAVTQIDVFNGRKRVLCAVCGYEYELYPDDSDPGCPKCISAIPVFTGNVLRYTETISNNEILEELFQGDGICYFSRGDTIHLELFNNGRTVSGMMCRALFGEEAHNEVVSIYRIPIRDEKMQK